MAKTKSPAVLDIGGSFGNVNIGDKTCRIGLTVARQQLSLSAADKNLCGKRLTGTLTAKENTDEPDQGNLTGFEDLTLNGSFDVKGFAVGAKTLSFGLTFPIEGMDIGTLAHFAKRAGRLAVHGIADIPEGEDNDEE